MYNEFTREAPDPDRGIGYVVCKKCAQEVTVLHCFCCDKEKFVKDFPTGERKHPESKVMRRRCRDCFTCKMCGEKKSKSAFGGKAHCFKCKDAYEKKYAAFARMKRNETFFQSRNWTMRRREGIINTCVEMRALNAVRAVKRPVSNISLVLQNNARDARLLKRRGNATCVTSIEKRSTLRQKNIEKHKERKDKLICEACREDGFDGRDWIGDIARQYHCNFCTRLLGHNRFDEESKRKWRQQEGKNADMTCSRCRKTHA